MLACVRSFPSRAHTSCPAPWHAPSDAGRTLWPACPKPRSIVEAWHGTRCPEECPYPRRTADPWCANLTAIRTARGVCAGQSRHRRHRYKGRAVEGPGKALHLSCSMVLRRCKARSRCSSGVTWCKMMRFNSSTWCTSILCHPLAPCHRRPQRLREHNNITAQAREEVRTGSRQRAQSGRSATYNRKLRRAAASQRAPTRAPAQAQHTTTNTACRLQQLTSRLM